MWLIRAIGAFLIVVEFCEVTNNLSDWNDMQTKFRIFSSSDELWVGGILHVGLSLSHINSIMPCNGNYAK